MRSRDSLTLHTVNIAIFQIISNDHKRLLRKEEKKKTLQSHFQMMVDQSVLFPFRVQSRMGQMAVCPKFDTGLHLFLLSGIYSMI